MKMPPPSSENLPRLSVGAAILTGHLLVNLPVLIIISGFIHAGLSHVNDMLWTIFFMFGFVLGWIWWSFMVPRWRRWALAQGIPEDKLQKWAVATGLTWPKGSVFEKTEFKLKDKD